MFGVRVGARVPAVAGNVALLAVLLGCSDPEGPGDGGSGRGGSSAAGGSSGASTGGMSTGGMSTGGMSTGGMSTGGMSGSGGSSAGGASTGGGGSSAGTPNASGASGSAGASGASAACQCPATAPLSGTGCTDDACTGPLCAYEDCSGAGFIQAGCVGSWFTIEQACGDKACGPDGAPEMSCAPGMVCVQLVSGAAPSFACAPHHCGAGAIGCDCLGDGCPGECAKTAGTSFTCNTCPSGLCP